jgi:hypothetical protein
MDKRSSGYTLNIYCDCKASEAHTDHNSESESDVLPAEKWVLFSNYPGRRKITGKLNDGILQTLHQEEILTYIAKKHNMTEDTTLTPKDYTPYSNLSTLTTEHPQLNFSTGGFLQMTSYFNKHI